jgi:hypothetical protein
MMDHLDMNLTRQEIALDTIREWTYVILEKVKSMFTIAVIQKFVSSLL